MTIIKWILFAILILNSTELFARDRLITKSQDIVLAGFIFNGAEQEVVVGQDSFNSWSAYDFRIYARPFSGTFTKIGGPGTVIRIINPYPYEQNPALRQNNCPSDLDKTKLYLLFLRMTITRVGKQDFIAYYVTSCVLIDKDNMEGFVTEQ